MDGKEIPARLIQIIEEYSNNRNISVYFGDNTSIPVNEYIEGDLCDDEPFFEYLDEILTNSDIEADSDGKYHLTREQIAEIAGNYISKTFTYDAQK